MFLWNSSHRGGSMALRGRVPSSKNSQGSDLFSQNQSWVTDTMSRISKFLLKMGLLAPKVSLRTGAWHPLSKFSGCPGTHGTHTAAAPETDLKVKIVFRQYYMRMSLEKILYSFFRVDKINWRKIRIFQ